MMQIVIDIPQNIIDDDFGYMDIRLHKDRDHINKVTTAISGDPYFTYLDFVVLPKGHGDLIDKDALDIPANIGDGYEAMEYIDEAPIILEADDAESESKND